MDLQKFELLLKKVSQAVVTIQKLKEKEKTDQQEIEKLQAENEKLKKENQELNVTIQALNKEIQSSENLQSQLEERIIEVLKFLPDEDDEIIARDTYQEPAGQSDPVEAQTPDQSLVDPMPEPENNAPEETEKIEPAEEREEEILKKFLNNDQDESKQLFDQAEEQDSINSQAKLVESDDQAEPDFENILFNENRDSEINFEFSDTNQSEQELPKGVL